MKSFFQKLPRYAAVSAISTSVTLSLLGVMLYRNSIAAGWANVIATAAGTVPSFELNRRWVWAKTSKRSIFKEIVPFCALSFSGLGLSTVAVSLAADWAITARLGPGVITMVALAANVATFGALWVIQYLLLDKVLFGGRSRQRTDHIVAGGADDGAGRPERLAEAA